MGFFSFSKDYFQFNKETIGIYRELFYYQVDFSVYFLIPYLWQIYKFLNFKSYENLS